MKGFRTENRYLGYVGVYKTFPSNRLTAFPESSLEVGFDSHRIHVWFNHLHLASMYGKCR